MSTPGALTSGFRSNVLGVGPREVKGASWSYLVVAPTVIARRDEAGVPIEPGAEPALPAATQHTTPAALRLSIASDSGSSGSPGYEPRLTLITWQASFVFGLPSGSSVRS